MACLFLWGPHTCVRQVLLLYRAGYSRIQYSTVLYFDDHLVEFPLFMTAFARWSMLFVTLWRAEFMPEVYYCCGVCFTLRTQYSTVKYITLPRCYCDRSTGTHGVMRRSSAYSRMEVHLKFVPSRVRRMDGRLPLLYCTSLDLTNLRRT